MTLWAPIKLSQIIPIYPRPAIQTVRYALAYSVSAMRVASTPHDGKLANAGILKRVCRYAVQPCEIGKFFRSNIGTLIPRNHLECRSLNLSMERAFGKHSNRDTP